MSSLAPTPKVAAGTISGSLSVIVIWLIEMIPTHHDPFHVVVPAVVAAAIPVIVGYFAAFFAPRSAPTPEQIAQIPIEEIAKVHPDLDASDIKTKPL